MFLQNVKLTVRIHELMSSWTGDSGTPVNADDLLELIRLSTNDCELQSLDRKHSASKSSPASGEQRNSITVMCLYVFHLIHCCLLAELRNISHNNSRDFWAALNEAFYMCVCSMIASVSIVYTGCIKRGMCGIWSVMVSRTRHMTDSSRFTMKPGKDCQATDVSIGLLINFKICAQEVYHVTTRDVSTVKA